MWRRRGRSPAALPGGPAGQLRNWRLHYPPEQPTVKAIIAVMHQASGGVNGRPMRALVVLLWRAGLRI